MRTLHMCMSVSGAIRNRQFDGLKALDGRALSAKEGEAALRKLQLEGIRVIPLSKDCEGFSYQTGCPGHEIPESREESVSETHTPEIRPATDEEIALRHTRGKSENEYWSFQQQLVARIESDRATIAELLAACEDLSERLTYVLEADEHGPDLCDADEGFQTRRCENDGCLLHAVKNAAFAIAKAKESR